MRGFVCVLVVAALAVNSQAQWQGRPQQPPVNRPNQPGNPNIPNNPTQPGVRPGGQQPGVGPRQPGVGPQQPGGRQPGVGGQQPGVGQQPGQPNSPQRPNWGQPGWGQPGAGQPGFGQPGQPRPGQPGFGQPGFGQPGQPGQPRQGQPGFGQPGVGGRQPGWPGTGGTGPGFGGPGAGGPGGRWPGTGQPGAGGPGTGWTGAQGGTGWTGGQGGTGWTGGQGTGFGGGAGPNFTPVLPDPNRKERCPKFWMEEGNSCYLYDSGAFLRRIAANTPIIVGNQDGMFQQAANTYCGSLHPNATLVTVNSLQENNFIYEWAVRMMVEPVPVWIGLHVGMSGQWEWFSGEPVTYQNWEGMQPVLPEPGLGAMIFDVDIQNQIYNNQVEITPQWVPEQGRNEPHALICEFHPADQLPTDFPPTTMPAVTRFPGPRRVPGRRPAMMNANRGSLPNLLSGSMFGGSGLHEVPRGGSRPANIRRNPYYAVQP